MRGSPRAGPGMASPGWSSRLLGGVVRSCPATGAGNDQRARSSVAMVGAPACHRAGKARREVASVPARPPGGPVIAVDLADWRAGRPAVRWPAELMIAPVSARGLTAGTPSVRLDVPE